jgi:ATP-dependent DNA helicase PIF1
MRRTCKALSQIAEDRVYALLQLDRAQYAALRAALSGRNTFVTGAAGTGKSQVIKAMTRLCGSARTAITASTGASAALVGGTTLHSFLGMGLGNASLLTYQKMLSNRQSAVVLERIVSTERLVVDECSMLDAEFFDKVVQLVAWAKERRNARRMQFIFVGDLLQLPSLKSRINGYIFEAKQWGRLQVKVCELKTIYRQSSAQFLAVLSRVRRGLLSAEDQAWIEANSMQHPHPLATCLFAKNDDADTHNRQMLARIATQTHPFYAVDTGSPYALNAVSAQRELFIKVGALVMCLKNIETATEHKLVNGSVGRVVHVGTSQTSAGLTAEVTVRFLSVETHAAFEHIFRSGQNAENEFKVTIKEKVVATRFQLPLRLAWAISVHRGQGCSLDYVLTNLNGTFEFGQAYTALSRVRDVKNLCVRGLSPRVVKADKKVLDFYDKGGAGR